MMTVTTTTSNQMISVALAACVDRSGQAHGIGSAEWREGDFEYKCVRSGDSAVIAVGRESACFLEARSHRRIELAQVSSIRGHTALVILLNPAV